MQNIIRIYGAATLYLTIFCSCSKDKIAPAPITFEGTHSVTVRGYSADLMEPFLSRNGTILLFNNSNDPTVNTNLHWAVRVNDSLFQYKGEITKINTTSLDGVGSIDRNGILYFVSTRDYTQTLASIFSATFSNGMASNIAHVDGLSKNIAGWVNFDVEVDAAGENLYYVNGRFDQNGGPYEADLVIAHKVTSGFQPLTNSSELLANINTAALEYAACVSANNLELYFTRVDLPISSTSNPKIFVSTRTNAIEAFGVPTQIESIAGFSEAATISPDGGILYYHKKVSGKFSLYMTKRIK